MSVDWTVDGNNSFMRVFREKDIGEEETSGGGGGGGDKMSALLDFCDSFTKKATLLHNPLVNAPKRSFIMGEGGISLPTWNGREFARCPNDSNRT